MAVCIICVCSPLVNPDGAGDNKRESLQQRMLARLNTEQQVVVNSGTAGTRLDRSIMFLFAMTTFLIQLNIGHIFSMRN